MNLERVFDDRLMNVECQSDPQVYFFQQPSVPINKPRET